MKTITHLLFSLVFIGIASCQELRTVKVTATKEDGTPIEGVDATITFLGHSSRQTQRIKGKTSKSGMFQASGRPKLRMYVRLEKDGYYTTISGRLSRTQDHHLTYVLREVKNPIPLYAKRARLDFPLNNEWIGYDFEVGDWTAPHGKGGVTMCYFKMIIQVVSDNEYKQELLVRFPNMGDGLVRVSLKEHKKSVFQWLYQAPNKNYQAMSSFSRRREPNQPLINSGVNFSYALRVNTSLNKDGNVISANYVRIMNNISLFGVLATTQGVRFTYYYNPTPNDRNLEFDPKRNLFTDLDPTEQVHDP